MKLRLNYLSQVSTPDVYQGYGFATFSNVLPLQSLNQAWKLYPHDALEIGEDEVFLWTLVVRNDSVPLRATIAWYDPDEAYEGNLVHNLDLVITSPTGKVYYGNGNVYGCDEINPNEQVFDYVNCSTCIR